MRPVVGWAAEGRGQPLQRWGFTRRDLRANDVAVRISHCGVCHSDLHAIGAVDGSDPLVPGHEFVGTVAALGTDVTRFSVGDVVAVGNIVDSCGRCDMCVRGQENFCREFPTLTYGGRDRLDGQLTQGAFSTEYVVRDHFVYAVPSGLEPALVAPLMCAGITVWEPLRQHEVGPGVRVGVAGIGGLGHLAVKLASALGAPTTVFTTSESKVEDARRLGATDVVVSTDPATMDAAVGTLDLVLDCISQPHDFGPYLRALDLGGTLVSLGYLGSTTLAIQELLVGRKSFSSAGSGGHAYTRELLDFCAEHHVTPDVEVVPGDEVNVALERLARNDVRYRFVLDLTT